MSPETRRNVIAETLWLNRYRFQHADPAAVSGDLRAMYANIAREVDEALASAERLIAQEQAATNWDAALDGWSDALAEAGAAFGRLVAAARVRPGGVSDMEADT